MKAIKNNIPNMITLLNLLSGCLGIVVLFDGKPHWAALFIFLSAFFDFLDGMVARLLNASSPIGKELDSLADLVSFGLLPSLIVFQMISVSLHDFFTEFHLRPLGNLFAEGAAFLIVLFSALRLAKFNIDETQTENFKGLPTPANAILIASLPLSVISDLGVSVFKIAGAQVLPSGIARLGFSETEIFVFHYLLNPWLLAPLALVLSLLLVSKIPMFSLKFKSIAFAGNEIRYLFLGLSVIVYIFFALVYHYYFIPLTIILILYIIISTGKYLFTKSQQDEIQS